MIRSGIRSVCALSAIAPSAVSPGPGGSALGSASIGEVAGCGAWVDALVRMVLGRAMAQRRSAGTALAYVTALSPGTHANCWSLAEAAGHEGPGRMRGLLPGRRFVRIFSPPGGA